MAREPSVSDEGRTASSADDSTENDGNNGLLPRRSYLKLAGVATAGVAGAAAAGTATAAGYEVITVPRGQREVIRVGSGETFENKIIDITASGASAIISAMGTNWTIRNVAFRGKYGGEGRAFGVADTGNGTSKIENVYLGDGIESGVGGARHPKLGLWVSPDHSGHLEISRMYVEGANDNAFYGSAPGSNGNGKRGTVHYRNCKAVDCRVGGFRISRGKIENCVYKNTGANNGRGIWVWPTDYHDDPVVVEDVDIVNAGRYAHVYDFGRSGRTTEAIIRNTNYESSSSTRFLGNCQLDESNVGYNPTDRLPEGCPDSVEAVFDGDYEPEPSFDYAMEFDGTGEFFFRTQGGDVEGTDGADRILGELEDEAVTIGYDSYLANIGTRGDIEATIHVGSNTYTPTWDSYDGAAAEDWVPWNEESDDGDEPEPEPEPEPSFEYTMEFDGTGDFFFRTEGGDVEGTDGADRVLDSLEDEAVTIGYDSYLANIGTRGDVEATIHVGSNTYTPTWEMYDGADAEDWVPWGNEPDQLENVILIDGDDSGVTRYEFVASGDIEKSTYDDASIDGEEVIDGNLVHGVVANWKDAFRFDGDLEELTVDGPGTVFVNDEEVDPDSVGQQLPHVLEVAGQGTPSSFNVTVDGTIEYDGDDADDVTIISGTTVESSVTDETQVFRFSGALTDITFTDGEAAVTLDGEEVDISEYGDQDLLPHAIVIDGTNADGPSTYSFTVDGKVVKSEHMDASIDDNDVIDGETVRGGVGNWLDAFWFEGNITDFKLVGHAKVHLEYNARDQ